jgi:predicted RNA-binding protein YlqC (UPF0109 family)
MEADQSIQEFLEFVIGGIIQHGGQASINRRRDERGTLYFDATMHREDVGRIIGRNGFVISSMRSLLDAVGEKHGMRVRLRIHALDEGGGSNPVEEEDPDGRRAPEPGTQIGAAE